jgi:acetoin utilization deacetylase AcuC-like enzyme
MALRLYYCDDHPIPLPPGHKFPMAKYALLRASIEAEGFGDLRAAPFATREEIERAHAPEYVRAFVEGTVEAAVVRRIGFPWSAELVRRTLASVGGTLAAARDALEFGVAGNLAGGTHHAFRDTGAGFCVFNDLAIAIQSLRHEGRIRRAAVIDLDVHQGDGTAAIFEGDRDVLTLSIHGENNFPFRKQRSSIDIGLADGAGDKEYLKILSESLDAVKRFSPDLVLYQSGVDALTEDRLGRLGMTLFGLKERDRTVLSFARCTGIPVGITLGGGYADPIELTALGHLNTFRICNQIYTQGATLKLLPASYQVGRAENFGYLTTSCGEDASSGHPPVTTS